MSAAKAVEDPIESALIQSGKVRKHRESAPTIPPPMELDAVPHRALSERELRSLPLDHRAGFVLAHIDGMTSVRDIVDISGMSQEEITQVVERLVDLRAIHLR